MHCILNYSECLNGEVTCFEDYVPNVSGQLNSTQLAKLKTELILLFYFQENREEHILVDVRHIHRYPTTGIYVLLIDGKKAQI